MISGGPLETPTEVFLSFSGSQCPLVVQSGINIESLFLYLFLPVTGNEWYPAKDKYLKI